MYGYRCIFPNKMLLIIFIIDLALDIVLYGGEKCWLVGSLSSCF